MNFRRITIGMIMYSIALLTLHGCTIRVNRATPPVTLPEHVYKSPANQDYSQATVAVFRFQGPNLLPMVDYIQLYDPGYDAAYRLYQQLLQKDVFRKLIPEYNYGQLTLDRKIVIAREKGCELLITGKVLYYFDGSPLLESRVDEEITVIDVKTKEALWYAESVEIGKTIGDCDLYFFRVKGEPAPPASSLLVLNAKKFVNMLSGFNETIPDGGGH
jgi:hypothetical protein